MRLLAANLGVDVDETMLTSYDIRELMSLQLRLQEAQRTSARPWSVLARRGAVRALLSLSHT